MHLISILTLTPFLGLAAAAPTTTSSSTKTTAARTSCHSGVAASSLLPAGGSAAGKGLNTGLFSITTKWPQPQATASTNKFGQFTNWKTFKANGVNLGGWFEIETSNNPEIFEQYAPDAPDEWTFCEALGSRCGPILEQHYATYYTFADIDKLVSVGVNFLRIPMTYAAWVAVPGSQLYHGAQALWLEKITAYAISRYGMRVAIGLHSLPGGVNDLDIGEAFGHDAWFYNQTNLEYSYKAIDAILAFIVASGNAWAFSISAINEASDNFAGFATTAGVTASGTQYIVDYINGVISRTALVDKRIPTVLQDCFLGEEHWSPYFANTTNLVIDSHIYYFAASGIYSEYVQPAICGQASVTGGDNKFPVYIGEWSLQVLYNNTFANRQTIFNTQRYAWERYVSGGSFWSSKFNGTTAVSGEGTQKDYWYYEGLIDAGVIKAPVAGATYC